MAMPLVGSSLTLLKARLSPHCMYNILTSTIRIHCPFHEHSASCALAYIYIPPHPAIRVLGILYELICWLSGSLTCRLPNVVRSPPARRSLMSSITVDWFLAPHKWGFNLKFKSTNYPDHGHYGDPPPTRKIPMVEPGIEPGTSWSVVRSSDH